MVWDALLWVDLLEEQLPPRRISRLAGQECNGGLPLAFSTLVASMMMVKHEQIEGLLGDLPSATLQRGPNERMDHFDQRGGPDKSVELVEHQRFEGVKLVANATCGARQPARAFSLLSTRVRRLRLGDKRLIVPCQHEQRAGLVRPHGTACRIHGFGLCTGDSNVIERRAEGREGGGNGGAVERCDHVAKPCQCRANVLWGAQSAMRRTELACFMEEVKPHG